MDKKSTEINWDKMARAYEDFTNRPDSYSSAIELKTIEELLPELKGKTVLDLGCGTGRFSFLMEKRNPGQIIGMDLSESMLAIGRNIGSEKNSKVQFLQNDIENLKEIESNSTDFVFSSTVLHFIENIEPVINEIYRVLKENGSCILSVIHPIYSGLYPIVHKNGEFPKDEEWEVNYLDQSNRAYVQPWIEYNKGIENFLTYSYHHTMSDYINSFVKAGFSIKQLVEPLPPKEWATEKPGRYFSYMKTPTYAIFKLEKPVSKDVI